MTQQIVDKMYCPMSFANSNERGAWQECDPNCAWALENFTEPHTYACAIAASAMGWCGNVRVKEIKENE